MTYTVPTPADFKARYTEFAGVHDPTVQAYLTDAAADVSLDWVEKDYPRAIMLLAAHRMLVEGQVERSAGETSSMTTTGAIASFQVGDVRVAYARAGGGSSEGGSTYPNGFGATEYGRRYYDMLRANFAGPVVV